MFYTGTVKWTTLKDRDRCVDSPKLGPWSCGSVLLGEGFRTLLKVPGQAEDSAAGRGEQHTCAPSLRRQRWDVKLTRAPSFRIQMGCEVDLCSITQETEMGCEVESHFWLHRAFELSLS